MDLAKTIEAVLFWKSEPSTVPELAKLLNRPAAEIKNGLAELDQTLAGRGIRLLVNGEEIALATAPEVGELIRELTQAELSQELSKAALETLAIVVYEGPVTKTNLDYIRGVNSQFILRHLSLKGLIEKIPHPDDARSFLYRPTTNLLGYLGVTRLTELPDYEAVKERLADLKSS